MMEKKTDKTFDRITEAYSILSDMGRFDKRRAKEAVFARTVARRSHLLNRVLRVAAVVLLPLVSAGITWLLMHNLLSDPATPQQISLSAPLSGVLRYELPDHSEVWLGSGASVNYDRRLGSCSVRSVVAEGECCFHVSRDLERPFELTFGALKILVHGTTFNCYRAEGISFVTLVEGKVEVRDGNGRTLCHMRPGEQMRYDERLGVVSVKEVETRTYTAWRNGEVYLDNTPVHEAADRLSRVYNIDIRIDNPRVRGSRLSVVFRGETLNQVAEMLALLTRTHYRIEPGEGGRKVLVLY